jgi:hypothetical protein
VILQDGSNDLDTGAGSWWLANQTLARSLEYAGYDYPPRLGIGLPPTISMAGRSSPIRCDGCGATIRASRVRSNTHQRCTCDRSDRPPPRESLLWRCPHQQHSRAPVSGEARSRARAPLKAGPKTHLYKDPRNRRRKAAIGRDAVSYGVSRGTSPPMTNLMWQAVHAA